MTQKEPAMHLIDVFMPVIAYVVRFRNLPEPGRPDYRQVREDIRRLLEEAEACGGGAVARDGFDQARFVVCAWIDETMLASDWNRKELWQHEQLQRLYYQTAEAGVEVFGRLEGLGPEERDLREVFCVCLSLGFKGRYIGRGDGPLLEQVKMANLKLALATPSGVPSLEKMELFLGALADSPPAVSRPEPASPVITPLKAMLLATPLVLFGVLYLVYRYVLNGLVLPIL